MAKELLALMAARTRVQVQRQWAVVCLTWIDSRFRSLCRSVTLPGVGQSTINHTDIRRTSMDVYENAVKSFKSRK